MNQLYIKILIILLLVALNVGCNNQSTSNTNKTIKSKYTKLNKLNIDKNGFNNLKFGTNYNEIVKYLEDNKFNYEVSSSDIFISDYIIVNDISVDVMKLNLNDLGLRSIEIKSSDLTWDKVSFEAQKIGELLKQFYGRPHKIERIDQSAISKNGGKIEYMVFKYKNINSSIRINQLVDMYTGADRNAYRINLTTYLSNDSKKTNVNSNLTKAGKRINNKHPDWSDEICNMLGNRQIDIGMTKEQVIAGWGRPQSVNKMTTANGTRDQWVYNIKTYVYFENGICTAIQN